MSQQQKLKNALLMMLYALFLGSIIGIIIWIFLKTMNIGIYFLWTYLPSIINFKLYPFIVFFIGSLLIGFSHKKYGDYPIELMSVIKSLKTDGKISYENLPILICIALLPLIFGGSIGPEAGLAGVIISLCCWAKDNLKFVSENIQDLANMGMSATLGIIFNSPMFGFISPFEESVDTEKETIFPKSSKIIIYFICILGGLGVYSLLGNLFGKSTGMPHFDIISISKQEYIWLVPISLISSICGILYYVFKNITSKILNPLKDKIVIRTIICGFILSIISITLPITLFSGESQIDILIENYSTIGFTILLIAGIVKLFITTFCIESGWIGGHIFPIIFSGVSIGYALGIIFPVNPIFAVTISTASICGIVMRKPLAVSLLLMLCFPVKAILWILIAALIGSYFPIPKKLL